MADSRTCVAVVSLSAIVSFVALPSRVLQAQNIAAVAAETLPQAPTKPAAVPPAKQPDEQLRVTIDVQNVPIATVVQNIARQAGLVPMYDASMLPAKKVTLRARQITAREAFQRVLRGTGLTAQILPQGHVVIKRANSENTEQDSAGTVTGRVTDVGTKQPVGEASIDIDDRRGVAVTQHAGTFRITGIAIGERRITVRRLGYRPNSIRSTVQADQATSVEIALTPTVTRLNEVVTTAVGKQRRMEVGNVISHLNADSIARTAPVLNLTDLLSARAPGVQVIETNGLAGGSVAIRIRGQGSLGLKSDPIVIVDGVRQNNSAGGRWSGWDGGVQTPSRLNDLDPNQIEEINILKGPAASTIYGTDAANGVIVITTKRGTASAPRWAATVERGWNEVPTKFPDFWYSWGRRTDGSNQAVMCMLVAPRYVSQTAGTCVVDSVTRENPLNHRATSVFGRGLREKFGVNVSGGTDAIRYFSGVHSARDIGTTQLPPVFRAQARALRFPESVFEPNSNKQSSIRNNLSMRLHRTIDVRIDAAYLMNRQHAPGGSNMMPMSSNGVPVILDSANNYGYGSTNQSGRVHPLSQLGLLGGESSARLTGGLGVDWRPAPWFFAVVTTGIDHGTQRRTASWSPQARNVMSSGRQPNDGMLSVEDGTSNLSTNDLRSELSLPINDRLRSNTRVGLQLVKQKAQSVTGEAQGLSETNMSLTSAPSMRIMQQGTASATAGGYVEQQISLADRLFLTAAVRLDGASGFGDDHRTTAYPKLNGSWVVTDRGVANIRVRAALGAAGQQPRNGAIRQTFYPSYGFLDGNVVSIFQISSAGNPLLRPERIREFEGGIDIGLWEGRLNIEVTKSLKRTTDAITGRSLGSSMNMVGTEDNLGDIRNSGTEASVQGTLVQRRQLSFSMAINASQNRNELTRLAEGLTTHRDGAMNSNSGQRHVVGYPLYGYWIRKATYNDANKDGVIVADEVTVEDTATYAGSSDPRVDLSLSANLGLLGDRLKLSAMFHHVAGGVLLNRSRGGTWTSSREANDSSAPVWMQARAVAAMKRSGGTSLDVEKATHTRLSELSATYLLPPQLIPLSRLKNVSVTAAARNVALWSRFSGPDPSASSVGLSSAGASNDVRSGGGSAIPQPRTWMVRFNVDL